MLLVVLKRLQKAGFPVAHFCTAPISMFAIFVDVDGGGFKPSGDTLGYPLPVKGLTADKVAELLKR